MQNVVHKDCVVVMNIAVVIAFLLSPSLLRF
jgi:hypothetical protein